MLDLCEPQFIVLKIYLNLSDFENMASEILQTSYELDQNKTELLLIRRINEYSDITCLQMAIVGNCLNFLSHPAPQNLITKIWYHKILPDTSLIRVIQLRLN